MWYFIRNRARHCWIYGAGYEENHERLMKLHPGASDAFVYCLRRLGNEAAIVIYGCDYLQSAWAKEHGLKIPFRDRKAMRFRFRRGVVPWLEIIDSERWHLSVLAAQIESFKPDIIFCYAIFAVAVRWLRSVSKPAKLIAWIGTERVPDLQTLQGYDLILTLAPKYIPLMRAAGIRADYLPAGFDERMLSYFINPLVRDIPVSFIGSYASDWGKGLHNTEFVARETGMLCYGDSVTDLAVDSAIRGQYQGECWGLEMYRVLARSKIVFNRHADVPLDVKGALHDPAEIIRFDQAGNMRLYEATGIGALLVTDRLENLDTLFEPDKEVVTYGTPEEAVEKIRYYLQNEEKRELIAKAGQERTLREHTYQDRARQLVDIINRNL